MLKEKLDYLKELANSLIRQGSIEVGTRLLKFCDDPTKPEFPIWCAKNNIDMFEPIAKVGFDLSVNYGKTDGKDDRITLETIASSNGHEELALKIKKLTLTQIRLSKQLLLRAKEGLMTTTKRRITARTYVEVKGVKQLIDEGAVVDWVSKIKATPLMLACQYGRVETVKLLIKAGADVNATDFLGATPLMWASYSNNIEVIKILLEAGADVNIKDRHNGSTAIIWWSTNSDDNVDAIKLLIKNHAKAFCPINVDKATKNGVLDTDRNALDHAKSKGNEKIVKFLEEYRYEMLKNVKIHHEKMAEKYNGLSVL